MIRLFLPVGAAILVAPSFAQAATCSFIYGTNTSAYCGSGVFSGFDLSGYSDTSVLVSAAATTGAIDAGEDAIVVVNGTVDGGLTTEGYSYVFTRDGSEIAGDTAVTMARGIMHSYGTISGGIYAFDLGGGNSYGGEVYSYGDVSADVAVTGSGYADFYGPVTVSDHLAVAEEGDSLSAVFTDFTASSNQSLGVVETGGYLSLYLANMGGSSYSAPLLTGGGNGSLTISRSTDVSVTSGDVIDTNSYATLTLYNSGVSATNGGIVDTDGTAYVYGYDSSMESSGDAVVGNAVAVRGDNLDISSANGTAIKATSTSTGAVTVDDSYYNSAGFSGSITGQVAISGGASGMDSLNFTSDVSITGLSGTAVELFGGDDEVTIGAGATLVGDFYLGDGADTLTITGTSATGWLDSIFYGGDSADDTDTLWFEGYADDAFTSTFDTVSLIMTYVFEDGFSIMFSGFESILFGVTTTETAAGDSYAMDPLTGATTNLSAVPVPAAMWLFGSALALLGLARRRRSGPAMAAA
ncbi:VPLPA-CTERM sorting domain-containing protein [Thioclava sp. 'Guangxiensis']|uniref:VPLPA-CTERM sorting domain-containing protein n=1 Tax=Thioclava sp. 'Guangxiensis' TaxID=3149044 RepID=UPI003877ED60